MSKWSYGPKNKKKLTERKRHKKERKNNMSKWKYKPINNKKVKRRKHNTKEIIISFEWILI